MIAVSSDGWAIINISQYNIPQWQLDIANINKRSPAGSSGGNRKWRFLGNVNCGGGDNVDAVVLLLCHGLVGGLV